MIEYSARGGVATILLSRPERLNALTREMGAMFIAALDRADEDPLVRAVIVTGAGRAFCAGADLTGDAPASAPAGDGAVERDFGGLITLRLFDMNKPVIAAVNGPAVGVGATMQLAMDVRIAASDARFGFVFARRGLVPEAASSWFLPHIVGIDVALRWCLSAKMVGSEEALTAGLISSVHAPDDLQEAALAIAAEFLDGPAPVSVSMTRRMLWTMLGAGHPMDAHILDSHALAARAASPDLAEGIAAFVEKRPASFADAPGPAIDTLFADWAPAPFR